MIDMHSLLAMYGGTFDPIHYGHLHSIEILASLIGLKQVIIIPSNTPSYRPQPKATSEQRKQMLKLATANNPLFTIIDDCEPRRNMLYTSQTMQEWRLKTGPERPLAFIIGQDSLLNFPSWYQYETILENVHLIVCRRPGYRLLMKEEKQQRWLDMHLTFHMKDLHILPAGKIYLAETPWFNISATLIRQRLQDNLPCDDLLPIPVLEYIYQQGLYHQRIEC